MKVEEKLEAVITLVVSVVVMAMSEHTSEVYETKSSRYITQYKIMTTAPSPLACVVMCASSSDCHFCAYRDVTADCFLHVIIGKPEDAVVSDVTVFADPQGAVCDHAEAATSSVSTVSWKTSGLEADVTCHADYSPSQANPTVSCSPTGQWLANGDCQQEVWTNPSSTLSFEIPFQLYLDWAMCVHGVACSNCDSFEFRLFNTESYIPYLVRVCFSCSGGVTNKVIVDTIFQGSSTSKTAVNFPFTKGQQFRVEFRQTYLEYIQILVGGLFLITSGRTSYTDITHFRVYEVNDGVSLTSVNLDSRC